MFELVQVSETCFYLKSPAKIGIVLTAAHEACLSDSGSDRDAGKKDEAKKEEASRKSFVSREPSEKETPVSFPQYSIRPIQQALQPEPRRRYS